MSNMGLVAGAIMVVASAAGAQDYDAPRNATVDAAGATVLRLDARAGSLRIEGRSGISEVRVRGTARASSRDLLDGIQLEANRNGSEVRVAVVIPEMRESSWNRHAALDLIIEVPASLPLDVRDSSGETEIRNVARLDIDDSSGELLIENVAGPLRVEDNSGSIRIRDAGADVWIRDSSGEIEVRGVKGSVQIAEDSSGEIDIADVTGSVRIDRDSSGGIGVSRVGGDFTVARDGGGGIDHRDVKGRVDIPRQRR
jgi:hypothetical protein